MVSMVTAATNDAGIPAPAGGAGVDPRGTPALEMVGIRKSYGRFEALRPTSLRIAEGEFVTLLGPSGSGKTTMLGVAAGIVSPDGGRVFSRGRDITDLPPHRRDVGMVFQRYTLFPNKTVAENVAFPLQVRKLPDSEIRERVARFLALVGLVQQADRYPSQISGGQAQRVALARALVFGPALLLMDEPLGALDRRLRQDLQEEIRRIQQETRVPTLYVTHDQDEAMTMSDRIAIARDGAIIAEDSPRDLYRNPPSLWVAAFLGDANATPVTAIASEADGWCSASTQVGLTLRGRLVGKGATDDMHAVIRPEDCRVHLGEAGPPPRCRGQVVAVTFVGPSQSLRIRLEGGWTIKAMLTGRAEIGPGATVGCDWDDSAVLIVPRN
jgi:ABC-type Fe3+/spermidine/putrescine transport system ATPase subunit